MSFDQPRSLITRLLDVIEDDIGPLTQEGVLRGDKIFGAAILHKADGSLVVAGSNEETNCPLWHGEIVAIRKFHEIPRSQRPAARECLFLCTHEPCSLCLSAITWAGFDNFSYLFSYEDSRDAFAIPHDLRILEEVFDCPEGGYLPTNAYWNSQDIVELIEAASGPQRDALRERLASLRRLYGAMSETYQSSKGTSEIPLA